MIGVDRDLVLAHSRLATFALPPPCCCQVAIPMALVPAQPQLDASKPTATDWKAFSVAAKRVLSSEELEAFTKLKKTKAKSEMMSIWLENGRCMRGAWMVWTSRSREVSTGSHRSERMMYRKKIDDLVGVEAAGRLCDALKAAGQYEVNPLLPEDEALWLWTVPEGVLTVCAACASLFRCIAPVVHNACARSWF